MCEDAHLLLLQVMKVLFFCACRPDRLPCASREGRLSVDYVGLVRRAGRYVIASVGQESYLK